MKKAFLWVMSVGVLMGGFVPVYAAGPLTVSEKLNKDEIVEGELVDIGKHHVVVQNKRFLVSPTVEITADFDRIMSQDIRNLRIGDLVRLTVERSVVTKIMVFIPQ